MAISRSLMNRQLQANGGIMQVAPRENFGAGTDTIRDYALGMNSGNGPITKKDYIDIYLFAGYDSDVASSLGDKHYKSGIGQDSNTKGFAAGGVVSREKFGLGSKLKSFVRKIIPNEIADIAVKAAPFVAPFNPAVGAAMSGLGRFDQTGSIGDSLKGGALTYGLGQGARYLGGAGFQGNPFASGGAFTPSGFTQGFSSPLGSDTGLGKFFSNRGTGEVQAIEGITADAEPVKSSIAESFVTADAEPVASKVSENILLPKAKPILEGSPNQMTITQSIQKILNPTSTMGERGNEALNLLKRGTKAAFTKTDAEGNTVIDKAAVIGAVTFAASYAEAKALAADAGIDLTEEVYDEAKKADKKEEYAGYLTNFFAGKKDGGRIGFESGANEMIKTQLLEEITPNTDTTTEDYVIIMTEDGPMMLLKSNLPSESMMMDTTTSVFGNAGQGRRIPEELRANGGRIGFSEGADLEQKLKDLADYYMERGLSESEAYETAAKKLYAKGGRVSRKFGSPKEGESEVGIMAIDVEAGDDEDKEDMMMAGITFSRPEKSYLFRKLGGSGGADRSFTMPQLYRILNNPNRYPDDAAVLKEIAIMGLGGGRKDGGRIGYKNGTNMDVPYSIFVKGERAVENEEINPRTGDPYDNVDQYIEAYLKGYKEEDFKYKDGGRIKLESGTPSGGLGAIARGMQGRKDEETEENFLTIDAGEGIKLFMLDDIDKPIIRKSYSKEDSGRRNEAFFEIINPETGAISTISQEDYFEQFGELRAKGGRIGYKGGANRVSELLILRDEKIGKGEDVSDIDAEIFQLTGKTFRSVGGISDIPTGKIRKNNAGVVERDYRDEGGFVPVGIKERADDVPAMLSKNEFVMTADAVRGIGNGSVEEGSKKLYNTMKQAEKVGKA